jgi:amino acid transporter
METKLSPLNLFWIAITSMIGSGWLFGPLYSAHFAGPAAILAWPVAGVLLLFVAMAYAEVATMFPQANILASLPLYTHGRLTSVIFSCLAWISLATIPVIETQGIIQYASNYMPYLIDNSGVNSINTPIGYLFALLIIISFVFLNYFGIRLFARINAVFVVWKLLIPIITIVVLLAFSYRPDNFHNFGGFMPYGWQGIMTAMSSGGVLFSLLGFRQAVIMMSAVKNPGKYVPLVLIGSVVFVALFYTALQWCFIGSLREQDLVNGWAKLSFTGDAGPFAALAALAGIMWLSILLYSDAFISPYSTGLVYSTTAGQMLASIGATGDAPLMLETKNKYQVPWVSLAVNFLLAVLMFLLLHDWQAMAAFLVAVLMISYAVGPIAVICLRKQLPDYPRPFRLPGGGFVAFIGFYVCTAGVYWSGLDSIFKLLGVVSIGSALYFCYIFMQSRQHCRLDFKNALWIVVYLLGLCIFAYFGNYGGNKLIAMYWDLLWLLGFCAVSFWLAIVSRKPNEYVQTKCQDLLLKRY